MRIITSEQVSAGHPDKICDQIADAIVTDCLQHDHNSRVAIECLFKNRCLVIAGELTSTHEPDYKALVQSVFDRINNGGAESTDAGFDYKLDFTADDLDIAILVDHQSNDIALGVNVGGAGDQGMMYGYATNETPEMLPIPFVLATRFLELLKAYPCRMLKADAKAQVSFDYDSGRITTFLCSVQHTHDVKVKDFKPIIEKLMVRTATEYGLNTDFEKLVNPTGRFVLGSSFADCGVTGRKLACDTYGGSGISAAVRCPAKIRQRLTAAAHMQPAKLQGILSVPDMRIWQRCRSHMPSAWQNPYPCMWKPSARSIRIRSSSTSMFVRIMTSRRGESSKGCICSMWTITPFPHMDTSENRGFRGSSKSL